MSKKIALLIGIGDYGAGLKSLRCPENGVKAMQRVLQDPEIGGFDEVISLVNPGVGEMRSRICEVFAQLTKQDLILFYFTGHGLKDMTGDFYLTTAETQLFANGRPNAGTAIEADFLKREIGNSLAERKVVVLDCCFGAAFAGGFLAMNSGSVDVGAHLGGKGWCLLTASDSSQYALERAERPLSVYTQHLVEGLKTGAAAKEGQRWISVRQWHEYVKQQVKAEMPAMEPAIFSGQQGYDIAIAKVKIDGIQQYRQQVKNKIRDGSIGPAARAVLRQWQQHCQLSNEQVQAIESVELQPYQAAQQQIDVYISALVAERRLAYPLKESSIRDLKDLQQLLKLEDKTAVLAERKVLGSPIKATAYQQQTTLQRNSISSSTGAKTYAQAACTQPSIAAQSTIQLSISSSNQALPRPIARPLQAFEFETIKIDRKGESLEKIRGSATAFIEDLGDGIELEMVKIPAGAFMMGAARLEEGANDNEYPQHSVAVSEFWMAKYTLTQAQWQQFTTSPERVTSRRSSFITAEDTDIISKNNSNQPATELSWPAAAEFCQWLSQLSGQDYRLPSQIQWEYACRANTTTPFYFGNTITPELANYNGNYSYGQGQKGIYRQQTTEVGSFPPNGFGLYDMHGNVWEWCLDNWPNFQSAPAQSDIARQLSGQTKTLRGGSWFYQPTDCRAAHRLSYPFHSRTDDIGFRVVCIPAR